MLNIQFNGEPQTVEAMTTVAQLLADNALSEGRFIVVVNDELVVQADYTETSINDGDVIDIMSPISGG